MNDLFDWLKQRGWRLNSARDASLNEPKPGTQMPLNVVRTRDVFIAGGQPTVTYNPRNEFQLESQVREYLDTRFKVLSVSGPTKSGKTVLLRRLLPTSENLWIPGGLIQSADAFWEAILERLDAFTTVAESGGESETKTAEAGAEVGAGFPIFSTKASAKAGAATQSTNQTTRSRSVSPQIVATRKLTEHHTPVVIDDFHYIDQEVQTAIIRALREPVFEGVPIILISVPHRAFDAVRVEREMTGRVLPLAIPEWTAQELRYIGSQGFTALNVQADEAVLERLVNESFSSPHLMQDFCGQLCRDNGVTETREKTAKLAPPASWDEFFRRRAAGTAKDAFDRLAIGPRSRTDRLQRTFADKSKGDIYRAVLLAIARTGPKTELRYEELRAAMREVLQDTLPQAHEITRVLDTMSQIARQDIEGEPVVYWDKEFSTLHVSDPFFAFYLRWGT